MKKLFYLMVLLNHNMILSMNLPDQKMVLLQESEYINNINDFEKYVINCFNQENVNHQSYIDLLKAQFMQNGNLRLKSEVDDWINSFIVEEKKKNAIMSEQETYLNSLDDFRIYVMTRFMQENIDYDPYLNLLLDEVRQYFIKDLAISKKLVNNRINPILLSAQYTRNQ